MDGPDGPSHPSLIHRNRTREWRSHPRVPGPVPFDTEDLEMGQA